jgi:hypothetical protein
MERIGKGIGIDDNTHATEDNDCSYIRDELPRGWFL